ncbi:molybdate ABC transporter substrate-binding protein [Dysgonomonas capnocytophagoides]|uniref:molybdate ABC transporter substrate-binding protein n=1 Tax=Dysgonomonas capnocytophagoides TaxID=45254 RepID=UPI0030C83035
MKRLLFTVILLLSVFIYTNAQNVKVAAAANLRYVLEDIKKLYEKENPKAKIDITFGSSGTLTQQIVNGAAFDLFMAADVDFPKKVKESGFANSEVKTYIYGKLALWSLTLDVSKGINTVLQSSVKKIAIANPKGAPYGESAVNLLKSKKLYDKISSRIVWGDNIGQAAQFAFSGNAELGFVALSLAMAPEMRNKGKYYVFNEKDCPPIEQAYVLIKGSEKNPEASKFINYAMSRKCDKLWSSYGYGLLKK